MIDNKSLVDLNAYLSEHSYVCGFQPTQADNILFNIVQNENISELCHVSRWFQHISSFGIGRNEFPSAEASVNPSFNISVLTSSKHEVISFYCYHDNVNFLY